MLAFAYSGLADGERYHVYGGGAVGIVIGTRSALFTPMMQLGIIIVDEEHDSSFQTARRLGYSARADSGVVAHSAKHSSIAGSCHTFARNFIQRHAGQLSALAFNTTARWQCQSTHRRNY